MTSGIPQVYAVCKFQYPLYLLLFLYKCNDKFFLSLTIRLLILLYVLPRYFNFISFCSSSQIFLTGYSVFLDSTALRKRPVAGSCKYVNEVS